MGIATSEHKIHVLMFYGAEILLSQKNLFKFRGTLNQFNFEIIDVLYE